jgi:hypothetical protein
VQLGSFVGFPSSPPHFRVEVDEEADDLAMKKPVGPLGWTADERKEYARTRKWSTRQVEAPEGPPGLSLSGRRSPDAENEAAAPPSREALWDLVVWSQRSQPGAKGKIAEDIALVRKLLKETGDNVEQARERFIVKQGHGRFIVEPPRARLIVRKKGDTGFTVQPSGKRVIDLTPQVRSVVSKRFTRAMNKIRKARCNKSAQ